MALVSNQLRPLHVYAEIQSDHPLVAPTVARPNLHAAIATLLGHDQHPATDDLVVDFLRLAVARSLDLREMRYLGQETSPKWCTMPLQSGPTAVCWQLSGSPPASVLPAAIDTLQFLRKQHQSAGVRMIQATVDVSDTSSKDLCIAAGLSELATLHYLERRVRVAPPMPMPPGFSFHSYRPETHALFLAALDDSYIETADCPQLAGIRKTEDVLESHKSAGMRFDPDTWNVLTYDNQVAGLLLCHESLRQDCFEVGYLGLAKQFRRRGLGRLLLAAAMQAAHRRRRPVLALAVDATNQAATKLYFRAGMKRMQTRLAMWAHS
jgi:ribosomal protein S18 acetylase RimI-like enzyme